MRGRLINSFLVELRQLDTDATYAFDPDGAGPLTSGYDPDFKEPVRADNARVVRKEKPPILVPCQYEDITYGQLNQQPAGNDPRNQITIVFHFSDLEDMGLVHATSGEALIRVGDRAVAIYRSDGSLIQTFGHEAHGIYCTEARSASFGLSGGERNLLVCSFEAREQTPRGAG